jgi:hypothetical protein
LSVIGVEVHTRAHARIARRRSAASSTSMRSPHRSPAALSSTALPRQAALGPQPRLRARAPFPAPMRWDPPRRCFRLRLITSHDDVTAQRAVILPRASNGCCRRSRRSSAWTLADSSPHGMAPLGVNTFHCAWLTLSGRTDLGHPPSAGRSPTGTNLRY